MIDDSDRNILASLAHEADESCAVCGEGVSPSPCNPPGSFRWDFTLNGDGDDPIPVHEECFYDARERAEEARAEARADRRS